MENTRFSFIYAESIRPAVLTLPEFLCLHADLQLHIPTHSLDSTSQMHECDPRGLRAPGRSVRFTSQAFVKKRTCQSTGSFRLTARRELAPFMSLSAG